MQRKEFLLTLSWRHVVRGTTIASDPFSGLYRKIVWIKRTHTPTVNAYMTIKIAARGQNFSTRELKIKNKFVSGVLKRTALPFYKSTHRYDNP
jgi:hypothetical protein